MIDVRSKHPLLAAPAKLRGRPFQAVRNAATLEAPVTKLHKSSALRKLQRQLKSRELSVYEAATSHFVKLEQQEPKLNSFLTVCKEHALAQARELDECISKEGTSIIGPLFGAPVAVKDNLCTKGVRTTAGSRILQNYVPTHNATSVERLQNAGAVLVGKTNLDEFGMGSSTENSAYKVTCNPWDVKRVPGGSSGGSAAAVCADQASAALGSDTGGSVRQPAHFCGVVGLKPSYGRVSRWGLVSYASSLDCVGPLARCVEDAAILLGAIAGADPHDATSSSSPVDDYASVCVAPEKLAGSQPLAGWKLGVVEQTLGAGVDAGVSGAVLAAMKHLEGLGAVVEMVSLPCLDLALPAYYIVATSEASSNLARFDGVRYGERRETGRSDGMFQMSRGEGLGAEVKRRILMGTHVLSSGYYDAYYKRSQQVRTLLRAELASLHAKYDALVMPTAPTPAYLLGDKVQDPLAMYKGDLMTVTANLAGLPAISVPCGLVQAEDGVRLPVGVQLLGKSMGEMRIIELAHVLEQTYNFD